jgi:5-hydroxyisourate hydrolase
VSTLSTHVLDTALGRPAQGVRVTVEQGGVVMGSDVTDNEGRARQILDKDARLAEGECLLTFSVGDYFSRSGREAFYPEIVVNFRITNGVEHYHVPLLLSPFGYSTYRGS